MNTPLADLDPAVEPLLQLVCDRVDNSMLQEIAAADYHQDVEAHLAALQEIVGGKIAAPMRWQPKEVLELMRWSEPEDPSFQPGAVGERGHWMRLFCCTVLIRAAAEPENDPYEFGQDSTIIQLVDSAIELGRETSIAALSFLCWWMNYRTLEDWDRHYVAIAILLMCVSLDLCTPQIANFLISAANSDEVPISELFDGCLRAEKWQKIIRKILVDSCGSIELQAFGNMLIGDGTASF